MQSAYSRPTTAKKQQISQLTRHSQEESLQELIKEATHQQKFCESQGKYVEAESLRRQVRELRDKMEAQSRIELCQSHEEELAALKEAHEAEMNLFHLRWEKLAAEFAQQKHQLLEELAQRHQQMEAVERGENKFKESAQLLALRRAEMELAKQENYMEAHQVQVKAEKMLKMQMERHNWNSSNRSRLGEGQLAKKQEREVEGLEKRMQTQAQMMQKQMRQEQHQLEQKFNNIMRETQLKQTQEVGRAEQGAKLRLLHKPTRGMFSYSRN